MRVLVTGGAGFAGRHLLRELAEAGHEATSFDMRASGEASASADYCGDLLDLEMLKACIRETQAEGCVHLAGLAFVPQAWSDPKQVMRVNLEGTINVLEGFRAENAEARIVCVSSAEVYGREPRPCVMEEAALEPSNLYGVSKMAADLTARLYARQYDMPVMTVRPQNHIGPGQSGLFVVSAFAGQLAALKAKGAGGAVRVGNLASKRDFTDVRDVARAYRLLLETGQAGEAYNVASGRCVEIGVILDLLCGIAGIDPERLVDPALYRPTDSPPVLSIDKIRAHTGWEPSIALEETLRDMYAEISGR